MHPILFKLPDFLGGFTVHTYGFMIALAFLMGWFYISYEAKRVGLNSERMVDLFFWVIVCALIGARVMFVVNSVDDFWADPMVLFRVWQGGLVFQGGLIGGLLFAIYYTWKHKIPFFKMADVFTVPIAFGHGLGRIGCFFAGCCFGAPCDRDNPLGIVFPNNPDTVAPAGIPLYPTQLMESFAEFAVFALLFFYRRKKPFDGAVFLLYMMIYAVLRSTIEVYRGDKIRGFIIEPYLSNGQFYSALGFIGAVCCWIYLSRKKKKV